MARPDQVVITYLLTEPGTLISSASVFIIIEPKKVISFESYFGVTYYSKQEFPNRKNIFSEGQDHTAFVYYALNENSVTPAQESSRLNADIVLNVKGKAIPVAGHGGR
jgi:hypothetical protein